MDSNAVSSKKRRFNEASSILAKPFKSPLRRDLDTNSAASTESTSTDTSEEKSHITSFTQASPCPSLSPSAPSFSPYTTPPRTTPSKPTSTSQEILASSTITPRARIASLQKEQHGLQSRLSRQRDELDTLNQAIKIVEQHKATELEMLIRKWRGVSREAAEDLFVSAKDKVNRMGGVRVYNEKMRKRKMREQEWGGWDDKQDGDRDDDEEVGSDVERELERRKAEVEEMVCIQEKEEGEREEQEESEGNEETFTMDMMLKGLHVNLELIGYDKDDQRWKKYAVLDTAPTPYNDQSQWGTVASWGYATNLERNIPELAPGSRLWGYCPTSTVPTTLHLKHDDGNISGHWVEVSGHSQQLMPLYNRYMQTPPTKVHDKDRMAWTAFFQGVWLGGCLLGEYVFSPNSQTPVHPLGNASGQGNGVDC
ncbi:hypothetical protein FQN49_001822 [Arthroderma sp. PD_2]|nr:hypothetical protein FQN49_001822 [Arthroderma sp. PD_2]